MYIINYQRNLPGTLPGSTELQSGTDIKSNVEYFGRFRGTASGMAYYIHI